MKWNEKVLLIEEIGSLGHLSNFCFEHISSYEGKREWLNLCELSMLTIGC